MFNINDDNTIQKILCGIKLGMCHMPYHHMSRGYITDPCVVNWSAFFKAYIIILFIGLYRVYSILQMMFVCLFHLDYHPHYLLNTCPPKRVCLESMDISMSSYSSPVRTHCPMSVAEQSSEVSVGGLMSVNSRRDECIADTHYSMVRLDHYFMSGSPLCPVELLMYSLTKIQFKTFTFSRHHSIVQYKKIVDAIFKVFGVQFEANAVRRFFPRISRNKYKTTVGKNNGKVRWNCYSSEVEEFICVSGKEQLERILNFPKAIAEDVIVATSEKLKNICSNSKTRTEDDNLSAKHFISQFNNVIGKNKNSAWIPWVDEENEEISLFRFGHSPGYAEKEIRLSKTFEWKLFIGKVEMDTSHCELFHDIPGSLGTVKVLVQLVDIIDNHKLCEGCGGTENYRWLKQ